MAEQENSITAERLTGEIIAKVKDTVSIPVIGNGDILRRRMRKNMMEQTNCDGVMIGRRAQGNPWIFSSD